MVVSRPAVSALQRAAFGSWADCSLPAALTALLARPQDVGSGHRLEPACLGVPSFPDMVSLLLSNQVLIKKKKKKRCVFFITAFPLLQCYRDLALVSRDGMNIVLNKINQILMEKYLKLQDTCRTQVRGAADLAETRRGHWSWRGGSWAHLEGMC